MLSKPQSRYYDDKRFKPCGNCNRGYIDMRPEDNGWERMPAWDTDEAEGWMTSGGVVCMHPKWEKPLLISALCNCTRRAMGLPMMRTVRESKAA